MIIRIFSAIFVLCIAGPALADVPVNVFNQTPRTIMVQVDEDFSDYGLVGSSFGTKLAASWTSNGAVGVVTIPGAAMEALIATVFSPVEAVAGSFTDYQVQIDLTNGNILSADVSGQVVVPVLGTQAFIQSASSTGVAGFKLTDFFGLITYPEFCTSGADCTIVPGATYDIGTGQLNAVGLISTVFQVFTPFGDLRLTELPAAPLCDVEMTQPAYVDGETTTLSVLRFANLGGADLPTRLIVELNYPAAAFTATAFDVGQDGSLILPTGWDIDYGPTSILPVTSPLPRGTWSYRCAIVDPFSGEVYSEDTAEFEIE